MTTLRPFDRIINKERSKTGRWISGRFDNEGNDVVVDFAIYHNKEGKRLNVSLTPKTISGYFERWSSDDAGMRILSKPIARYSAKALDETFDQAFAFMVENLDNPTLAELIERANAVVA
jgi:hypothetical protein